MLASPLLLVGNAPDRRLDGGERIPIRRNAVEDFREVDRRRRENAAVLQLGAPARDPPNAAYREWHENAWTGQHPAPPAEDRYYRRNIGNQAEYRGRDEGWYPTLAPTNLTGRRRTRTPRGNNRAPGPDARVFIHDGNAEYEVVDYDVDWWEEQNQRSQHRRNMEYQRGD